MTRWISGRLLQSVTAVLNVAVPKQEDSLKRQGVFWKKNPALLSLTVYHPWLKLQPRELNMPSNSADAAAVLV